MRPPPRKRGPPAFMASYERGDSSTSQGTIANNSTVENVELQSTSPQTEPNNLNSTPQVETNGNLDPLIADLFQRQKRYEEIRDGIFNEDRQQNPPINNQPTNNQPTDGILDLNEQNNQTLGAGFLNEANNQGSNQTPMHILHQYQSMLRPNTAGLFPTLQ